jgi:hypothetical protein
MMRKIARRTIAHTSQIVLQENTSCVLVVPVPTTATATATASAMAIQRFEQRSKTTLL